MLQDIALDGLVYWLPMLTHALIDGSTALGSHAASSGGGDADKHCGSKDSQLKAVLLTAIPFGTAAVAALALGHSSEVSGERRKHVGLPLALGGCCFSLLPLLLHLRSVVPAFLAVTAAVVAADATTGPFWVSVSGEKRVCMCGTARLTAVCVGVKPDLLVATACMRLFVFVRHNTEKTTNALSQAGLLLLTRPLATCSLSHSLLACNHAPHTHPPLVCAPGRPGCTWPQPLAQRQSAWRRSTVWARRGAS